MNTSTSLRVQASYADGSSNTIRPTGIVHPDAAKLDDRYGGTLSEPRDFYYTDDWRVVEERIFSNTYADRSYVWGVRYLDDLVLRDHRWSGGLARRYALEDANWNVTSLATDDGTLVERYSYTAYGEPEFLDGSFAPRGASSQDWDVLYAGYRRDGGTGLYSVRNRIYSPALGVWATRDPLASAVLSKLYLYASARPTDTTDPAGLQDPFDVFDAYVRNRPSSPPATEFEGPLGRETACVPRYRGGKVVGSMGVRKGYEPLTEGQRAAANAFADSISSSVSSMPTALASPIAEHIYGSPDAAWDLTNQAYSAGPLGQAEKISAGTYNAVRKSLMIATGAAAGATVIGGVGMLAATAVGRGIFTGYSTIEIGHAAIAHPILDLKVHFGWKYGPGGWMHAIGRRGGMRTSPMPQSIVQNYDNLPWYRRVKLPTLPLRNQVQVGPSYNCATAAGKAWFKSGGPVPLLSYGLGAVAGWRAMNTIGESIPLMPE